MKKVFIHINPKVNFDDPSFRKYFKIIIEFLKQHDVELVFSKDSLKFSYEKQKENFEEYQTQNYNEDQCDFDFALSLGGDGTFLTTAELLFGQEVGQKKTSQTPIFGFNFGHIGFLSDGSIVNQNDIEKTLKKLISGDFKREERTLLKIEIRHPNGEIEKNWALNEVALEKGTVDLNHQSGVRYGMLNARLEIDGHAFSKYGCDGIIVSTPTGSTAHAFSAGGPIVWPKVDAIVIAPIAAHALFSRPIVVGADSVAKFYVDETEAGFATLVCDGRRSFTAETGCEIEIQQSAVSNCSNDKIIFAKVDNDPFTKKLVEKFRLPVDGWK